MIQLEKSSFGKDLSTLGVIAGSYMADDLIRGEEYPGVLAEYAPEGVLVDGGVQAFLYVAHQQLLEHAVSLFSDFTPLLVSNVKSLN